MAPCCRSLRDAAKDGHVECVRRFRQDPRTPWDPTDVLELAARNGHVDVILYALNHRAAWTPTATRYAVAHMRDGGADTTLQLAMACQAPWDADLLRTCVEHRLFSALDALNRSNRRRYLDVTLTEAWVLLGSFCRTSAERRVALEAMDPAFVYLIWQVPNMHACLYDAALMCDSTAQDMDAYVDRVARNPHWTQ